VQSTQSSPSSDITPPEKTLFTIFGAKGGTIGSTSLNTFCASAFSDAPISTTTEDTASNNEALDATENTFFIESSLYEGVLKSCEQEEDVKPDISVKQSVLLAPKSYQ
jgi:hypothetical protein